MTVNRLFLIYATVIGAAAAAILVWIPASRTIAIPPYFWVLIALALFDGAAYMRGGGAPGTMISPVVRFGGFAIAMGLLLVLPQAAGIEIKLF